MSIAVIGLKAIATFATEHTQLSESSSLYTVNSPLRAPPPIRAPHPLLTPRLCTKVTSHAKLCVIPCVRNIGSDSL